MADEFREWEDGDATLIITQPFHVPTKSFPTPPGRALGIDDHIAAPDGVEPPLQKAR